jgi:F-type H+-transporting ATPase subunit b
MSINAEFWVAIAFLIFVALMFYLRVHRSVFDALDQRSARIRAELDEALRLRQEAEKLVEEYRRKHREADREAEAIVATAKTEAERLAAEAKSKLEDLVARRTRMAETKIAQAEAQALADVRAAAADAAVAAAERILSESVKGKTAEDLVAQGIRDVKAKLN